MVARKLYVHVHVLDAHMRKIVYADEHYLLSVLFPSVPERALYVGLLSFGWWVFKLVLRGANCETSFSLFHPCRYWADLGRAWVGNTGYSVWSDCVNTQALSLVRRGRGRGQRQRGLSHRQLHSRCLLHSWQH